MIQLFYYLALYQNKALGTSLCIQLHFSVKRGKYHYNESDYLCLKKKGIEKGKTISDLR